MAGLLQSVWGTGTEGGSGQVWANGSSSLGLGNWAPSSLGLGSTDLGSKPSGALESGTLEGELSLSTAFAQGPGS